MLTKTQLSAILTLVMHVARASVSAETAPLTTSDGVSTVNVTQHGFTNGFSWVDLALSSGKIQRMVESTHYVLLKNEIVGVGIRGYRLTVHKSNGDEPASVGHKDCRWVGMPYSDHG
jgi:hypothetical protein